MSNRQIADFRRALWHLRKGGVSQLRRHLDVGRTKQDDGWCDASLRRAEERSQMARGDNFNGGELPTIISFYGGQEYYYQAAASLRADCERLQIRHHIEELPTAGLDWAGICRQKISFYQRMQHRYGAVLWVDVDDRILKRPEALAGCNFDIAGFGGRFRYIRDYDPYKVTRFWVPSVLFFGNTEASKRFLARMAEIEAAATGDVTDDWVLHEAWMTHTEQLNVGLLAPALVARKREQIGPESVILHGDSGSVSQYRSKVVQHERRLDNHDLRGQVLLEESRDLMKSGQRHAATILARQAWEHSRDNEAVAVHFTNYLKLSGRSDEAQDILLDYVEGNPSAVQARYSLLKLGVAHENFALADQALSPLLLHSSKAIRGQAQSLAYELDLDRRAHERGFSRQQRPSMWWMKTPYPGNFGDILSPWLVEQVGGVPPRFGQRGASLLAVGSIVKFATAKSTVWGTGTPRLTDALSPQALYKAVRGPLTRDLVISNGGECPKVFGDPALLLPRFLPRPVQRPQYRLGLIRHVNHQSRDIRVDGVKEISLTGVGPGSIQRVVEQITDCEAILSTSLHGVIVANAYGIPARWCIFSDDMNAIAGDGTKYADYFKSVSLPMQDPFDLSAVPVISETLRREVDTTVEPVFDAEALIDAYHS